MKRLIYSLRTMFITHPRLMAWGALATAMVIIFLFASAHVAVTAMQKLAMVSAVIVVAGLCVWIIYWD